MSQSPDPPRRLPGSLNANRRLDRWLRINRDGTVTVFPGKVEIGQGILTALSQIVAEELDVSLARIRLAQANTSYSPNEGMTSGSQSITDGGVALRYAAAEARDLLLQRAAPAPRAPRSHPGSCRRAPPPPRREKSGRPSRRSR